jgi:glycosyltransferase involved in cell wall biosynthesis
MGAPQSRLFETARGLKQKGWDIRIITAMPNYPTGKIFDKYRNRFFVNDNIEGIDIWRYWLFASNSKNTIPRIISMLSFSFVVLFALFKIRKFKPDYIFTESPPLTLGLSGLILSKLSNSKHVMNVSDLWPLSAFELGAISKGFLYNRLENLEKYLYKKSFACTGQSQEIIDQLINHGSTKTHLYRNGVDFDRFEAIRNNITNTKSPKIKIVYAGLLGVAQGIFDLCKKINFSDLNVEFHIYGDGAEKNDILLYLNNNKNRGIYIHESVKRDLVPNMLMQYDITIIPLIKPIFGAIPSKIYEAMAAGLPIIFAGGGEGSEIISKYKIGWVCVPSNFEEMKSIIKEVSTMDEITLLSIKNNCMLTAKNIFDRKIQIEQLNNFLLENV